MINPGIKNIGSYHRYYSETSLREKLKRFGKRAGLKLVYPVLLLYQLIIDPAVDAKVRFYIAAGLGYFILPFDLIPDFAPLLGFSDDLSVLLMTMNHFRKNIAESHRTRARAMLMQWFTDATNDQLDSIEQLS